MRNRSSLLDQIDEQGFNYLTRCYESFSLLEIATVRQYSTTYAVQL